MLVSKYEVLQTVSSVSMSRRRPATALGQLAQIGGLAALGGGVLAGVCAYKGDQPFYRGLMALAARSDTGGAVTIWRLFNRKLRALV